jgi:ADP-ribosylglycohydrolase
VSLELGTDGLKLTIGRRQYFFPFVTYPNGERDAYATLAACARAAAADGIDLLGCASCVRFRFSGMSQQFSGGEARYCALAGFRSTRGIVSIDHGCGEFIKADGWPGDLDAAYRSRMNVADSEPRPSRLNAFEGAIVGLAAGDALGHPAEFHRRADIIRTFGPDGIQDFVAVGDPAWRTPFHGTHHPAGTYTDDTQMSLAVAEALVDWNRGDLETLMQGMASRFADWSRSPENDRSPGATTMTACGKLASGVKWREAGVPNSKGCGSAMRVAPIGLFFWRDIPRLLEAARASSLITHGHDAAVESSAAAALLVALAMSKRNPEEMFQTLMEECAPRSPDLKACLERLPRLLQEDPAEALSARGLGEGWVAEEAVVSALYCFWRNPLDFRAAVLSAVNTDGDSDSIACIVGGISGAFNGLSAIPESWQKEVENGGGLIDVARRLCHAAESSG